MRNIRNVLELKVSKVLMNSVPHMVLFIVMPNVGLDNDDELFFPLRNLLRRQTWFRVPPE